MTRSEARICKINRIDCSMTDPLMPAFCCKKSDSWTMFYNMVQRIDSTVYNSTCLISATCGMLGAASLILPQVAEYPPQQWYWISSQRANKIILWLAVSDLLASAGIFSRSLMNLWFPEYFRHHMLTNSFNCYFLSFYIQYFYIVSWLWTLIYSFDMWLALKQRPSYPMIYHIFAWILPAIFTLVGLCILYLPTEKYSSTVNSLWKFLPNYLAAYVPLIVVMIMNAIIYFLSSISIPDLVAQYLSQYTNAERYIVDNIRIKFGLINLTFFVCWLPNIANAIIIFFNWDDFPERVIIALWYLMAIINPLQAFFNALVYGKPATEKLCLHKSSDKYFYKQYREKTPLLHWKSVPDFDNTSD